MIGYSQKAKTRYHCGYRRHGEVWAMCDATILEHTYPDEQEAALKEDAPDLSRCPRCWPEAALTGARPKDTA